MEQNFFTTAADRLRLIILTKKNNVFVAAFSKEDDIVSISRLSIFLFGICRYLEQSLVSWSLLEVVYSYLRSLRGFQLGWSSLLWSPTLLGCFFGLLSFLSPKPVLVESVSASLSVSSGFFCSNFLCRCIANASAFIGRISEWK